MNEYTEPNHMVLYIIVPVHQMGLKRWFLTKASFIAAGIILMKWFYIGRSLLRNIQFQTTLVE